MFGFRFPFQTWNYPFTIQNHNPSIVEIAISSTANNDIHPPFDEQKIAGLSDRRPTAHPLISTC